LNAIVLGTYATFLLHLGRLEGFQFRIQATNLDFKRALVAAATCEAKEQQSQTEKSILKIAGKLYCSHTCLIQI
jgi:hypothetical protein